MAAMQAMKGDVDGKEMNVLNANEDGHKMVEIGKNVRKEELDEEQK